MDSSFSEEGNEEGKHSRYGKRKVSKVLLSSGEPPQLALISAVAEQWIPEGARGVWEPGPAGKKPAAGACIFWSQQEMPKSFAE